MSQSGRITITVAALISTVTVGSAAAETQQQKNWCEGKDNPTPDLQISGCTASIQSGKYAGNQLAIVFDNRGLGYARKKDYQSALADFDQAIRLDPNFAQAFNDRCTARRILNQSQAALADCTKSIQIKATVADTYDSRAFTYLKLGQFDNAIADFDASLRLNPKMATSLYGRGLARVKKGDNNGGIADMVAAKKISSNVAYQVVADRL